MLSKDKIRELQWEEEQERKNEPMYEWIALNRNQIVKDFLLEHEDEFSEFCERRFFDDRHS